MRDTHAPRFTDIYDTLLAHIKSTPRFEGKTALFKEALREYFFLAPSRSLREFFDGKKGQNGRDVRKLELIRQLHFGFHIPYQIFHDDLREEHIFTKYSPRLAYLREFVPLNYLGTTRRDETEFANRYVTGVERFIKEATKSLFVYDYLGKGRKYIPGIGLPHYEEAHKHIFRMTETQLKNQPQMKYKRFLALPFSDSLIKKPQGQKNRIDIKRIHLKQAILECSAQTFEHICRCFNSETFKDRVNFYIVWLPTRLYHYGIIDDRYILSEYYRYKTRGDFVPDLLFVEDVSDREDSQLEDLLRIYKYEIENKFSGKDPDRADEFYKEDWFHSLKAAHQMAIEKYQEKCEALEKEKEINQNQEDLAKLKEQVEIWNAKKILLDSKVAIFNTIFSDSDSNFPKTKAP